MIFRKGTHSPRVASLGDASCSMVQLRGFTGADEEIRTPNLLFTNCRILRPRPSEEVHSPHEHASFWFAASANVHRKPSPSGSGSGSSRDSAWSVTLAMPRLA